MNKQINNELLHLTLSNIRARIPERGVNTPATEPVTTQRLNRVLESLKTDRALVLETQISKKNSRIET